jgi:hypothetical protein
VELSKEGNMTTARSNKMKTKVTAIQKQIFKQRFDSNTGETIGEPEPALVSDPNIPEGTIVYMPEEWLRLSRAQWQLVADKLSGTDNDDFGKEVLDMLNQSSKKEFTVVLPLGGSEYFTSLIQ